MGYATSGQQYAGFCHPWEFTTAIYCCFDLVAKERSLKILVELNLDLCDILEISIFSSMYI